MLRIINIIIAGLFVNYVVVFAAATPALGNVFEVPIYRKPLEFGNEKTLDTSENDIEKPKPPNPWKNDTVSLQKFMDAEYFGIIRIGRPAKEFKVVFATTWADTWLPSAHCGLLEMACMIHTRYDSSRSSTYQEDGTPAELGQSETNDLRGFVSQDHFHLAHITLENQSFVEVTHMPFIPYGYTKADGIVGLAFPSMRRVEVSTFFTSMLKQGLIEKPVFTFYFNRDPTTEKAGRLILGATERKYVNGSLTTVPVINKTYWSIRVDRILLEGNSKTYAFCKDRCEAILDTTTNTITGPTAEVEKLNILLGARAFDLPIFKTNRYMVNCREFAKLPPINFVIAGVDFNIHSKYYIQHLTYESMEICLSPFVPNDGTQWLIGGAFLMQFYTEYNFNTGQVMIGHTKY